MERTRTGKGIEYLAPIFPVKVKAPEQIANPQKTIGMVARAVKPRLMTDDTVEVRGGASMSLVQYA